MDPVLLALISAAASAGAAFGGVRKALNGTVKRVELVEHRTDRIETTVTQTAMDVAQIKGRLSSRAVARG